MTYLGEDWQCMLILDACRYDVFEEVYNNMGLSFPLEQYDSGATNTVRWYKRHWNFKTDVVLTSANPRPFSSHTNHIAQNFKSAYKAWRGTKVRPKLTLKFFEEHKSEGNKHLVHFMPPHLPFIGAFGKRLLHKANLDEPTIYRNVYTKVGEYGRKGNWDEVQRAYTESVRVILTIVLEHYNLFKDFKTVITSDHAELIGHHGYYCHNARKDKHNILRKVPWMPIT